LLRNICRRLLTTEVTSMRGDSIKELGVLKVPVYITENGTADAKDTIRPRYIIEHLREVRRAIRSGVDVRGYFHWTFQDNFEWRAGYTQKFGLFALDPTDPELERTPRRSAEMYARIARAGGVTEDIIKEYLGE
jgi:beta-glucosidase/6-phospho-beta-glucosidase/beta-galactosidase